ncbi:SGNH/GDSL hydrolase family protein [Sunxiuqinia indica]|uniref:SGNH/GDSL hydrolase family protein n=1 Tax=Sunxiuqinia indica TaxID=2692584 RepID=UPI001F1F0CC7|nr:SGNH/GDSL hydrolase family protein [Sunxiuqinia indica]
MMRTIYLKHSFRLLLGLCMVVVSFQLFAKCTSPTEAVRLFAADNFAIQYVGRVDFSDPALPRFWSPGVYIEAYFEGDSCQLILNDEMLWGKHNYVSVVLDDQPIKRIMLAGKVNVLDFSDNLDRGKHRITVCKSTESGIGYLEFVGLRCQKLLKPEAKPLRKIEFYGNSITCGTGIDTSVVPCGAGEWHDQHNAYMSYGPVTARSLNAQWMLTAVSGIGLVHSCCDMDIVMPQVYDKVNLRENKVEWDFSSYQPDVVTIALGQNDGIQDSTLFCSGYIKFIHRLRTKYPSATIVCLSSPMADGELAFVLKKYIASVVEAINQSDDSNVHSFFFSKSYSNGCDYHPDLKQHAEIAEELTCFIRQLKGW